MATVPNNLTDETVWDDATLDALRVALLTEQERRYLVRTLPQQVEQQAVDYQRAIGRKDGSPWVQPVGGHDAFRMGAVVTHKGKTWESTTPNNVWEPGVSGWREKVAPGAAPAPYRQPTGSHDAYKKGDRVTYKGGTWESVIDGNVWSPTDHPAGWKKVA